MVTRESTARPWRVVACAAALTAATGCSVQTTRIVEAPLVVQRADMAADPVATCAAMVAPIPASAIGVPSGAASIDTARWVPASPLAVAARGPTPAARVTPALPEHCQVIGRIAPLDPSAPPIRFQVNLPRNWNGRSVQYGGGGFNGVLINGLALVPASRFDTPAPLAQGFVTVGTDSGHETRPGEPPQAFALNDEALVNFAHASYKKVRDVSMVLVQRAYGRAPTKRYFVGSSEGGREGLTMAQRYPADFDGIFSRVPVINWTGLQHAGTRNGIMASGDGWLRPAQVKLVADEVLAACDGADGLVDGLVSNPFACRERFDVAKLRCTGGSSGDACLNDAQVRAVQTLHTPWRSPVPLAHGVTEYPGWGVSGEATPAFGPTGGWNAWWLGTTPPTQPPQPTNGIAWFYGGGAIQYFYARDPRLDLTRYRAEDHAARIRQVSELMDSTDPDLTAFQARGGKLVLLENMADYAQSPYAGVQYYRSVVARMGQSTTDGFFRFYTAPNVDHVGSGGPANVDVLPALVEWVERGQPPAGLTLVEQTLAPPFAIVRARPLCEWPAWPRYRGGEPALHSSFECVR